MDIKQLINFITIVEEGNITKAAQKLHISQPPLSNQLKALEEELGVKLIERGSRKVTLTDVGNLLYKRGKDMVNVFESTLNEVEDFKSGIEGVLKIGAVSTCNQFIPNELISPYAKQYPKVKFELYEGNTYEVVDMIERGIVDIGVVRTPFNRENLCCLNLRKEPMVVVVNKNGEKFGSRTTIAWAQAGLAIGIVPKSIIDNSNKEIEVYELDEEELKTQISVAWMENKYLPRSARNLLDMIRKSNF